MSAAYETILLEKESGLGLIRFNRPKALNAINLQMLNDVDAALTDLETDSSIRVIAITGTGRAFSAGRDLKEIGAESHVSGADLWSRLETIEKPAIAGVNGLCYTGALSMLACFDIVLASEDATFADTHAKYGMLHGGGSTQRLRNLVGPQWAKQMLFTCEPIDAHEAERIGLVTQVVAPGELDAAIRTLADKIARNDAFAIGVMKRLVNDGLKWGSAIGFEFEAREYRKQRREETEDLRARTGSFFNEQGENNV